MRNRPCATWCGRPAARYAICCQRHWETLSQHDRERIRASYRAKMGRAAYLRELVAEVVEMKRQMRGAIRHG